MSTAYRSDLARALLGIEQQLRPLRECNAALFEVIVAIVGPFNTAELMAQTSLGDLPPHPLCRQMRARRAT